MPSATHSLQQSIFAALAADATLVGLLGGQRIYDDVPQGSAFPYLSFGHSIARDWSTGSDDGTEHIVTVHVWSQARGKKEAHAIMDAVHALLHEQSLTLAGHHLVNLRHEFSEARRDPDGATIHGLARFRAVTEPA